MEPIESFSPSVLLSPPPSPPDEIQETVWSWEQNKVFEFAVAELGYSSPNFLPQVAAMIPGKTIAQIEKHYSDLVEDLESIEAGLVPLPEYPDDKGKEKSSSNQRGRGRPWTKEEHELFLKGLEIRGKGDWKGISRYFVLTKNPTQIASHAQKYFLRLERQQKKSAGSNPSSTSWSKKRSAAVAVASNQTEQQPPLISSKSGSVPGAASEAGQHFLAFPPHIYDYESVSVPGNTASAAGQPFAAFPPPIYSEPAGSMPGDTASAGGEAFAAFPPPIYSESATSVPGAASTADQPFLPFPPHYYHPRN